MPAQAGRQRPRRVGGFGLWVYDAREFPLQTGGNVYCNGARPYAKESRSAGRQPSVDPKVKLVEEGEQRVSASDAWARRCRRPRPRLVTTERLGKARIAGPGL